MTATRTKKFPSSRSRANSPPASDSSENLPVEAPKTPAMESPTTLSSPTLQRSPPAPLASRLKALRLPMFCEHYESLARSWIARRTC